MFHLELFEDNRLEDCGQIEKRDNIPILITELTCDIKEMKGNKAAEENSNESNLQNSLKMHYISHLVALRISKRNRYQEYRKILRSMKKAVRLYFRIQRSFRPYKA